ncbi:MAG: hypothetical protein IJO32_06815 [Bacilli bacterium]|nr:hypothetical protein [Bacilli bacterium]
MTKYDLDNFYIGELHIPQVLDNVSNFKQNPKEMLTKIDLEQSGALPLILEKPNTWNSSIKYDSFLTIFYRNKNGYVCLHNGNLYNNSKYINNLVSLKKLLPKTAYNISEDLSIKEGLKIFKSLFKKNTIFNKPLYNNDKFPLNKFYVGKLKFCYGLSNDKQRIYYDVPQKYMLFNNGAKIMYYHGLHGGTEYLEYDYLALNCLLLKHKNKLLNLHNNQIYPEFSFKNCNNSYYQNLLPYTEYLENNDIKYNKEEISIPKALKLYKK